MNWDKHPFDSSRCRNQNSNSGFAQGDAEQNNVLSKHQKFISVIRYALKEDVGRADITTEHLIPKDRQAKAIILAKEDFVVCGISIASAVFTLKDKNIRFKHLVKDGDCVKKGKELALIEGPAQGILTAERVALNFLSLLSGIATKTKEYVKAAGNKKVKIIDTRKTIPGLRLLQKYAVRMGGGYNHRFSLEEMVLVKDNHLKIMGNFADVKKFNNRYKVELEAATLDEFKNAIRFNPDIIMLDNMSIGDMKKAVVMRNCLSASKTNFSPKLEASGGVTLKNIKKIASTGVDMISVGALTHTIDSVDLSLEIL